MSRFIFFLLAVWCASVASSGGAATAATPNADASADQPVILIFGDSLSAGYGIDPAAGWVNLLRQRLRAAGYDYTVSNGSISGETTAGGLARLPRALQVQHPQVVVLELGGNDGLRALPLAAMRSNLEQMLVLCEQAHAKALLVGIRIPPNYGPRFTAEFDKIYVDLAHQHKVPLVPFFLEHVYDQGNLMQADALHPNAAGQALLLDNVWPTMSKLLQPSRTHKKAS